MNLWVSKMKTIEIFGENRQDKYTKFCEGCRGIVIRGGKLLLVYEKKTDRYFLPGGGVEEGETLAECCVRELREETGCVVAPHIHYLTLEEFYHEYYFKSHYFVCGHIGVCEKALTKREIENELEARWIDLNEAINIFGKYNNYKEQNKLKYGAYYREYVALCEFISQFCNKV